MRSGHTEAAVDLCRLAGLAPVGVLAELVNDDGTVKRGADVARFADEHGLKRVSVADLIAWRQRSEKLVERVAEFPVVDPRRSGARLRLPHAVRRDASISPSSSATSATAAACPSACIASRCSTMCSARRAASTASIARLAKAGRGVIVYLREGSVGVAEVSARARDAHQASPRFRRRAAASEWREVGLGAQILTRPRREVDPAHRQPRAPLRRPRRLRHRDRSDRDRLAGGWACSRLPAGSPSVCCRSKSSTTTNDIASGITR